MRRVAVIVLVPMFAFPTHLRAQSSAGPPVEVAQRSDSWRDRIQISGLVDACYAHNFNRPADRESFISGTGSTAKRAQEFALNLVAVDLAVDPAPVGAHLTLAAGNGLDVIHSAEISGSGTSPDVWRHLYQAYLSYRSRKESKLTIDSGVFPSHVGLEGFFSKDNWTYTRSWMGEFSPYYQTGVRATYQLTEHAAMSGAAGPLLRPVSRPVIDLFVGELRMKDLLFLLLALAFFASSWAYVKACEQLDAEAREDKP